MSAADPYLTSHLVDGGCYRGGTTEELTVVWGYPGRTGWFLVGHERLAAGRPPEYRIDEEGWARLQTTIIRQQFDLHIDRLMLVRLRPMEEVTDYRRRWAEYDREVGESDG